MRKQRLRESLPQLTWGDSANARVVAALVRAHVQGEMIRVLWDHTRPILLDLHRSGVRAANTWRTIPSETGDDAARGTGRDQSASTHPVTTADTAGISTSSTPTPSATQGRGWFRRGRNR